ncbi:MAG: NlpC/P60 family protein [Eubacteriales bacterium]|nr:NlpC/P60 family protein [Eubacteriales bacterium]
MKKEMSKKQIFVISLISLILLSLIIGADLFLRSGKMELPKPVNTEETVASDDNFDYSYAKINSALDLEVETVYEPGPTELNLAFFYPEGVDESNVINSYAGQIYSELSTLEAKYLASFYDFSDLSPLKLANQLGLSAQAVTGKFNPEDSSHNVSDPQSWTIDSFKNVHVLFYDGDGNRINDYSSVQEILSMASVYSYYHDLYDAEAMKDYAVKLFDASKSDSINIGEVYYCNGCLNRSVEQEALEVIEYEEKQKQIQEEIATALREHRETKNIDYEAEYLDDQATTYSSNTVNSGNEASGNLSSGNLASDDSASGNSANSMQQANTSESNSQTPVESIAINTSDGLVIVPVNPVSQGSISIEDNSGFSSATTGSDKEESSNYNGGVPAGVETMPQTEEVVTENSTENVDESQAVASQAEANIQESAQETAPQSNPVPNTGDISIATQEAQTAAQPPAQTQAPQVKKKEAPLCPGHVDVYIRIKVKGIDDKNSLFKADTIGNDKANFNDRWQGWTEDKIEQVKTLNSYDWIEKYGLTLSALSSGESLTAEEIKAYMDRLPADISKERRAVVEFALNSVGKVPYYWGGKPACPGYEGNNFNKITYPDHKGRILKGLDCSGWINWVYRSALNISMEAESTGTLIGTGRKIKRADLKPGDIIIRTGQDAHVVMFLEWTKDGKMLVVHESAGVTNNVTVSEMTANWPYYRNLLD